MEINLVSVAQTPVTVTCSLANKHFFFFQVVVMVTYVLLMELLEKVVWSSVITTTGGLCVMTPGTMMMLALFAGSWDSLLTKQELTVKLRLVRALVLSCWMMSTVLELRADWLTVLLDLLAPTTVDTTKMLESVAYMYQVH